MELLARERTAEQNVQYHLKATDEPIASLLQAFAEYREACLAAIFADFDSNAATTAAALWLAHTKGKKYFHQALNGLRKQAHEQPVAIRQLIRFYLGFLKDSQRFYTNYIVQLNARFGNLPELAAVAHQLKGDDASESLQTDLPIELRQKLLKSCHQSLIYLGDLSRYRASDKLDKAPNFGPAIGYYDLACTLVPSSGMGHHQLAVVALEQRQHLHAIYHLYRAMVVDDPHPHAPSNLKLEFDKTNAAWDRGELIPKAVPNDPDVSKRTLIGWFVRLHSMCYRGEEFRGFEELVREVLAQICAEVKLRSIDSTLKRMVMVNLAAQYNAGENFQANPTLQHQNAFMYFFRINVKTFTALLQVFYDGMKMVELDATMNDDEEMLASRLSEITRRVMPVLRYYSAWLLSHVHVLQGLSTNQSLRSEINQFWRVYARAIDLVSVVFPIWELEDLPEIAYMLDEDADTIGFRPLQHARTNHLWHVKETGVPKPRASDLEIIPASQDEEMLIRIRAFLVDGLFLANDDDDAPIKLRGTRILHRDAEDLEPLPANVIAQTTMPNKPGEKPSEKPVTLANPKALSYAAAAAATARSQRALPKPRMNGQAVPMSQHARLSRMVDDLVDDEDSNNPVTPPQQFTTHPAVVNKSDISYSDILRGNPDIAHELPYAFPQKQPPIGTPAAASTLPFGPPPRGAANSVSVDRFQTMKGLWQPPADAQMSSFPPGLPTGTLSSPAQIQTRAHSRVSSNTSMRSKTSKKMNADLVDSWSSFPVTEPIRAMNGLGNQETDIRASPLMIGGRGDMWNARRGARMVDTTPPSGQGG